MIRFLLRSLLVAVLATLLQPVPAHAGPIIAAIAVWVTTSLPFVSAAVDTFVFYATQAAIYTGLSLGATALFGAKATSASAAGQARQASVTTLQVSEQPRQAIFGRMGTAGTLVDAFDYGGQYGTDFECRVIRLADHECDGLEGIWVNDVWVPYTGDGLQSALNNRASWWFLSGAADQTLPGFVYDAAPNGGGWDATSKLTGICALVIVYEADAPDTQTPQWSAGRPTFLPVLRGKKCYDPRLDDTVGGSGAHRWADPSTWEWSENAIICRYNWVRGVFALDRVDQLDQLLVGRGLTIYEADPARVFAPANLCDESVDTPTGSEPRYRVGGVIRASDDYATVEQWFADATAGNIIQPSGTVEIDPGQAKTPVFDITDDDLIAVIANDSAPTPGALEFNAFGSQANRINTVIPQYVDPTQMWATATATVQRDFDDVLADGAALELTLSLTLVTSRYQAERIGAIKRRQARLERAAKIVLPPKFAGIEEGDWGTWTSARHTGGAPMTVFVQAFSLGPDWRNSLVIAETDFSVYGFGDHTVESPGLAFQLPPDSLALGHVTAEAVIISGDGGEADPGVRFHWDVPTDPAIQAIRAEIRLPSQPDTVTASLTNNVNAGIWTVTDGIGANYLVEVRLVPVCPGRDIAPSDWIELAVGESVATRVLYLANRLVTEALAQLDDASAKAAQLISDSADLAKATMAQAMQLAGMRAYVNDLTQVSGDTLVSVTQLLALMRSDRQGVNLLINSVYVDPNTDETVSDRLSLLSASDATAMASILAEQTARISAVSAEATARLALAATVGTNTAAIATNLSAQATINTATATSISTLSTTVGGHTASITTLVSSTNGLLLKYGVSLDSGGRIIGWAANNNGSSGSIVFVTDLFAIGSPDGVTTAQPFLYDSSTDTLYLQSVYVTLLKADIVETDHLIDNSVTARYWASTGGGIAGNSADQNVLSFTVVMARAGTIFASATLNQGFGAIPASWLCKLYIDGNIYCAPTGTVPGDAVPLSGQAEVAAGNRVVTLTWNAPSSSTLGSCGLAANGFYK